VLAYKKSATPPLGEKEAVADIGKEGINVL
jgi:hypothetical protein